MGDSELLDGLRKGDSRSIETIYRVAFKYCSPIVTRNGGQLDDARDLFQESIMVLHRQTQQVEFDLSCAIKTYLYSVMRNLWLKRLRKEKKTGIKLVLDDEESPIVAVVDEDYDALAVREEKYAGILTALDKSKSDCRKLLMEFYYKKTDLSTLAQEMGYTYQFIKVKKNRCMNALKKRILEFQS